MTPEDLVARYWRLAPILARSYARPWPQSEHADILSDAMLGLIKASRAWDPEAGASFPTYARTRIRGEILDGLKLRHGRTRPAPRTDRRRGFIKREVTYWPLETSHDGEWLEGTSVAVVEGGFGVVELAASVAALPITDHERGLVAELAAGRTAREIARERGVGEDAIAHSRRRIRAAAADAGLL